MKSKWVVIVTLFLVALAVVAASAQHKRGFGRGFDGGMGHGFGNELAVIQERLQLTEQQKEQVGSILQAQRSSLEGRQDGRGQEHEALMRAIFSDNPDQAAIQQQISQLQQKHAETLQRMVSTGAQINQVLTSEQRAQLHQYLGEKRQKMTERRERMRQRMQERRQQQGTAPAEPN